MSHLKHVCADAKSISFISNDIVSSQHEQFIAGQNDEIADSNEDTNFSNGALESRINARSVEDFDNNQDCPYETSTDLIVLHPDHPLMKRFQGALHRMLTDQISKAAIELREKNEELKRLKCVHLELGSELYTAQQELSKFQGQLQKKHQENLERQTKREKIDEQLLVLRRQFKKTQMDYDLEYKKMLTMREEVDNLALRLFYLNNAKLEVKSDITIIQRAAEKASLELNKVEEEKLHQDMVAHRMQRTVDQILEDTELLKEQLVAAEEELRSGEIILKDMESQVLGIKTDRKRLMAHWTTSLIGLQRRNEAYAELMKDFQQVVKVIVILKQNSSFSL